jgi:hypothetical protein
MPTRCALFAAKTSPISAAAPLEHLNQYNISTTLVVTLKKGLNDHEIGDIIAFALKQKCVRGVTFQPVQVAGRVEDFDPATDRLTLSAVRQNILDQSKIFAPADIIPVPCHPDCLAMAYALKLNDSVVPLTGMIPADVLLQAEGSTIVYERNPALRKKLFEAFSTAHSPMSASFSLKQLLCCLPLVNVPDEIALPECLPHHHHEIHGRLRLGYPQRQKILRPHRPPRRQNHSIRQLQSFLS